jgi:hypothetical protein
MKDYSDDELEDERPKYKPKSEDNENEEVDDIENEFMPKDENTSNARPTHDFIPRDEDVEYWEKSLEEYLKPWLADYFNDTPESIVVNPSLSDSERIHILKAQLETLENSYLDHNPYQRQIDKIKHSIFELQKRAGMIFTSNFESRPRSSKVFPNYNIRLGPKGGELYDELSFITDLKAEIENHSGRISDPRMSAYLGQIYDYIRYVKKNAKRNPNFHIPHQELQEFKQNLRSHIPDISLKTIRKYKKLNSLRIGKSKVYDYNEYFVENYFKEINSLEKAYWLGFIYADGTLGYKPQIVSKDGNRYVRFRFSQIYRFGKGKGGLSGKINHDGIEAVNRLANALGIHPSKVGIDNRGAYSFEITSKTLADQLNRHGVIIGKDKTYNIRLPNLDSRELYISFTLGYFDGDGIKCTNRIISGSKDFLSDIKNYFDISYEILPQKSNSGGTAWILNLGAETFNEMMDTYEYSFPSKRRRFLTSDGLIESRKKYKRPEITDEFLSELQFLLFKAPEPTIAEYHGISQAWLKQIIKEKKLNKPPPGYWVRKKFQGDNYGYF